VLSAGGKRKGWVRHFEGRGGTVSIAGMNKKGPASIPILSSTVYQEGMRKESEGKKGKGNGGDCARLRFERRRDGRLLFS